MKAPLALAILMVALPARAQQAQPAAPAMVPQMDDAETPPAATTRPKDDGQPRDQPTVPVTLPAPDAGSAVPPPIVAHPLLLTPWSPDDPRNYKLVRNTGLMIAGGTIFGGAWAINAISSAYWGGYMAIPIVGPWVMASMFFAGDSPAAVNMAALLVLDGAIQLAGATMLIVGAVTHHRQWSKPIAFAPIAGRDYAGASFAFRF
jgi:hypothetical protein